MEQAGLCRTLSASEKSFLSLNATGSHWRVHKRGRGNGLHFSKVTLAVGEDKGKGQAVGMGKAETKTAFSVLKGPPASDPHLSHGLQETAGS